MIRVRVPLPVLLQPYNRRRRGLDLLWVVRLLRRCGGGSIIGRDRGEGKRPSIGVVFMGILYDVMISVPIPHCRRVIRRRWRRSCSRRGRIAMCRSIPIYIIRCRGEQMSDRTGPNLVLCLNPILVHRLVGHRFLLRFVPNLFITIQRTEVTIIQ